MTVTAPPTTEASSASASVTTTTAPATHDVRGTLDLTSYSSIESVDHDCTGTGGYSDLQGGANVVVRDDSGHIVGTGSLGEGSGTSESGECKFPWAVHGLTDADFYTVEIANRKGPTYSRDQLVAVGWTIAMKIGDGS